MKRKKKEKKNRKKKEKFHAFYYDLILDPEHFKLQIIVATCLAFCEKLRVVTPLLVTEFQGIFENHHD